MVHSAHIAARSSASLACTARLIVAGLFQCNSCREQFTVTVNTVCERSKIPLTKWCMAIYLLNASKKGMTALQMHRMMGGSYKTAWFMMHRIREAMREGTLRPLGGKGKFVEADETYVGGKAKNRAFKAPTQERSRYGLARARRQSRIRPCPERHGENLAPDHRFDRQSQVHLRTDESLVYPKVGNESRQEIVATPPAAG